MNLSNKHKGPLSREDISQYMSTKDERLKHSIEKKANESDFESDALDGWSSNQVPLSHLSQLDKKFSSSVGSKLIVTSIIMSTAVIVGIVLFMNQSSKEQVFVANKDATVQVSIDQSDVLIPEHIDSMVSLPKNEAIQPKLIQKEFKQKISTPENIENTKSNINSDLKITNIPLLKLEKPKIEKLVTSSAAKEIYLSDLKLVDYREYRTRPMVQTKTLTLTGVPANQEDAFAQEEDPEWTNVDIPYYDYIKKTQEIFNKENYKKALTRYLTILETYPDDVNALFYSGLCYYNLTQYSASTGQFFKCLDSRFNNFNEEAEWFIAKSYQASGEYQKANSIFEMILEKNGYYAPQAKLALKK